MKIGGIQTFVQYELAIQRSLESMIHQTFTRLVLI